MPIDASPSGTLDIENATLRSREIVALTNMVAGNDVVSSLNPPTLEIYGDPEPTLELVSNVNDVSASAFARLTSNAGVFSIQSGVNQEIDSKGDIAFTSINGNSEHMRIVGSTGRIGIGTTNPTSNLHVMGDINLEHVSNVATLKVNSNVVTEYTGPHDRPLRKYPEVALTADDNLSTSGYKASVSSLLTGNDAFNTFDVTGATSYWHSQYPYYTHVTGTYNPGQSALGTGTPANGTTLPTTELISGHQGEWIKLQMPKKIKLEEVRVYASSRAASSIYQMPKDIAIAGSNDGTNWYLVDSGTLRTGIRESYGMASLPVTTSSYYSHLALIVKTIDNQGANYSAIEIANIEYYGREEGSGSLDTTLKSVYNVPATTGTQLEVYYDGQDYMADTDFDQANEVLDKSGNNLHGSQTGGVGFDSTYKAFTFGAGDYIQTQTLPSTFIDDAQHSIAMWFNLANLADTRHLFWIDDNTTGVANQSPHAVISSAGILRYDFFANDIQLLDQIVPNQWYHLVITFSGGNHQSGTKFYINGVHNTNVSTPSSTATLDIQASSYIVIGANNIGTTSTTFNGSIANFRLYSKALNADQVKELYDYQKDYFLGSKSQVTLYKGHLGVGVTEPSGQLELAGDERIQEYPPGPLSNYDTHIPGHGVFCAYASSGYTNGSTQNRLAYNAFDKASGSGGLNDMWQSVDSLYNGGSGTNQSYTGSVRLAENLPKGHYLGLKMPYPVKITSFIMGAYFNSGYRAVGDGLIVGRNTNNPTWEVVHTLTNSFMAGVNGFNIAANAPAILITTPSIPIDNTKYYDEYALVVTGTLGSSLVTVSEWRLFGTPGPTTLDKGSLSLTRSLDVPRVSRYDVDTETPRPEKLVLDFDTTVNSSPTDISGKGNHGAFYNGASYSPADKAFNFDGTDDSIRGVISNPSGDWVHSISFWFKLGIDQSAITGGRMDPFTIGRQGSGGVNRTTDLAADDLAGHYSSCDIAPTTIDWYFYGNDARFNISGLKAGEWHHLTFAYEGGGAVASRHAYFDGVEYPNVGTSTAPLAMFQNSVLALGMDFGRVSSSPSYFNGQISNFKIYNAYLEASEVQKLYRLGRTGRSMVISDTAVGIGKVPEAQLDVRGTISATSDIQVYSPDGISKIRTGKVGMFFQNSGRNIDPDTQFSPTRTYSIWESNVGGEGAYIAINGDNIVMSSPCDDESLRYYDEDDGNEVWNISNAGALVVGSDSRRKHDIKPVIWENVLKKIGNIEPSTFKFKQPESYTRVTSKWDKEHIGFIAQNVQENFPELVTEDGSSENYLLVNSSMMILPIIQGIQQLTNELEAQKAKNESLETQVSDLLVRMTALENA